MVRATLAATMLLASVPNCTDLYSLATHGLNQPVVTAQSGATATPAGSNASVTIPLLVNNPNDFPISVDSVDYAVTFSTPCVFPAPATQTGTGFSGTQEGVTVDEQTEEVVTIRQTIPLSAFPTTATGLNYTICGVAHADSPAGVQIDVAFSATSTFGNP
jgi:LEA14-like dessication related protein